MLEQFDHINRLYLQESMGGLSNLKICLCYKPNIDLPREKRLKKLRQMHKNQSMKSELFFVSNEKLTKDQINAIREIDLEKDGNSSKCKLY